MGRLPGRFCAVAAADCRPVAVGIGKNVAIGENSHMTNAPRPPHEGGDRPRLLLYQDTLVFQQITGFMSNDFDIFDERGATVGRVHTGGSGAKRFLMGSREFEIYDADGRYLLKIDDTVSLGRDRWQLLDSGGAVFADIVRRFAFMVKKVDVDIVDGPQLALRSSDLFDFSFGVSAGDVEIARTDRQWAGVGNALLGHDRYVLHFRHDVTRRDRLAIIGTMIALDLMRQKSSN